MRDGTRARGVADTSRRRTRSARRCSDRAGQVVDDADDADVLALPLARQARRPAASRRATRRSRSRARLRRAQRQRARRPHGGAARASRDGGDQRDHDANGGSRATRLQQRTRRTRTRAGATPQRSSAWRASPASGPRNGERMRAIGIRRGCSADGASLVDRRPAYADERVSAVARYSAFGQRIDLRAAEERDLLAVRLARDLRVPHLRRVAQVHRPRHGDDRAFARGAEEVGLELDRREVLRALGQVRDAAEARRGVGERDHRRRVQVAVGREELRPDVELGVQQALLQVDDAKADEPGQAAVAAVLQAARA